MLATKLSVSKFIILAAILLVGLAACAASQASEGNNDTPTGAETDSESQATELSPEIEETVAAAVQSALDEQATDTQSATEVVVPSGEPQLLAISTPLAMPNATVAPLATLNPTPTTVPAASPTPLPTLTPIPTHTPIPPPTATPEPTPTTTPTPTATPTPSHYLYINGIRVGPGQDVMFVDGGTVRISPTPGPKGAYEQGTLVTLTAYMVFPYVDWTGVDGKADRTGVTRMGQETFIEVFNYTGINPPPPAIPWLNVTPTP